MRGRVKVLKALTPCPSPTAWERGVPGWTGKHWMFLCTNNDWRSQKEKELLVYGKSALFRPHTTCLILPS
ncbi:MAG: hypothetical protein KatS3mg017_0883 [Fimbriimonadales bacterium]|nr:MAG: hypothetical protein KatS3mg017_0883 [Fimbriimonadales bacterium]